VGLLIFANDPERPLTYWEGHAGRRQARFDLNGDLDGVSWGAVTASRSRVRPFIRPVIFSIVADGLMVFQGFDYDFSGTFIRPSHVTNRNLDANGFGTALILLNASNSRGGVASLSAQPCVGLKTIRR